MSQDLKFYNLGSGWLSTAGYGFSGSKARFEKNQSDFQYPELTEYIAELPSRFGRFDVYTRVCFSTAVLALKDAGLLQREGKKNIGIIVGSSSGVYNNDFAYFNTTLEAQGAFTSPNLFSYTLPNVALGEIAVFFKFTGPAFCVGNDPSKPGMDLMPAALSLLHSKQCDRMLVGWVEAAQSTQENENSPKGATFAVLSLDKTSSAKAEFSFNQSFQFGKLVEG